MAPARTEAPEQTTAPKVDPDQLRLDTVKALDLRAEQWARDFTRAEHAYLIRRWPKHPRRGQVVAYVIHAMGGKGHTTATASQIAHELKMKASTVRNHLSAAYADDVLEAHQIRRRQITVERRIERGLELVVLADEFVRSGPDEPVRSRPDTLRRETTDKVSKSAVCSNRAEPTPPHTEQTNCVELCEEGDCGTPLTKSQREYGDTRCKPCHQRHKKAKRPPAATAAPWTPPEPTPPPKRWDAEDTEPPTDAECRANLDQLQRTRASLTRAVSDSCCGRRRTRPSAPPAPPLPRTRGTGPGPRSRSAP